MTVMRKATPKQGLLTRGEYVRGTLRQRILSGELAPGERLSAAGLAREFGVSRIPVRDALIYLERTGLVEGRPGIGYQVADPRPERIAGLWRVRIALECEVARCCALRADDEQLAELANLARRTDEASPGFRGAPEERELAFHRRLAQIVRYEEMTEALVHVLERVGAVTDDDDAPGPHEHAALVQEIASRDPQRADAAMRAHLAAYDDLVDRGSEGDES